MIHSLSIRTRLNAVLMGLPLSNGSSSFLINRSLNDLVSSFLHSDLIIFFRNLSRQAFSQQRISSSRIFSLFINAQEK